MVYCTVRQLYSPEQETVSHPYRTDRLPPGTLESVAENQHARGLSVRLIQPSPWATSEYFLSPHPWRSTLGR